MGAFAQVKRHWLAIALPSTPVRWIPPTGLFLYVGLRITFAYVRHYDAQTTAQLSAGQHRRRRSA